MKTDKDGNYPEPCEFLNQLDCDESYIDKVYDSVRSASAHKGKTDMAVMQLVNDKMQELDVIDKADVLEVWFLIEHQGNYDIESLANDTLYDTTLYDGMTLEDVAREFVDEGLFGDIPKDCTLLNYINFESLGEALQNDGYEYIKYGDGYKDFGVFYSN